MAEKYREEQDSMGKMKIPNEMLFGASTQRAVDNFAIGGLRLPLELIHALAAIKACCAQVNRDLGLIDRKIAQAVVKASNAIAAGEYDSHFVVEVFQTGSGTSTNMNFNEVAANIANLSLGSSLGSRRPVHPNDHVNKGQSSNDVFPSAIHVAATLLLRTQLIPTLKSMHSTLEEKAVQFRKVLKIGRTHLQDATPLYLGQEFSGYAAQVSKAARRVEATLPSLSELAVGGTAVGTGIATAQGFGEQVCRRLSQRLGIEFSEAANHFEAQGARDACVEVSSALKTASVSIFKIANDIRWMGSGPRCGLGEIELPQLQPGSSIMPGKVNPVLVEAILQVCAQVIGNDAAITWGGAHGNFELNTMMPLIAHNLIQSIRLLNDATALFDGRCLRGLKAHERRLSANVEKSLMLATALVPHVGYDRATKVSNKALLENRTIRDVAEEELDLSREQLEEILNPLKMAVLQKTKRQK